MRVRRARTRVEMSLVILAFSLGESVVNHLQRRCAVLDFESTRPFQTKIAAELTTLPWRERRRMYLYELVICGHCSFGIRSASYLIAIAEGKRAGTECLQQESE